MQYAFCFRSAYKRATFFGDSTLLSKGDKALPKDQGRSCPLFSVYHRGGEVDTHVGGLVCGKDHRLGAVDPPSMVRCISAS
jgi:hypothetical protein